MSKRHQFRPSGPWHLEDRIALSHAPVAAEVASAAARVRASRLVVQGFFVTIPPLAPGGSETTNLAGHARFGRGRLLPMTGVLESNPSLPPPSGIFGGIVLVSPRIPGSAFLTISGPSGSLAPTGRTRIPISFNVEQATGPFSRFLGVSGAGTLVLRPQAANSVGGLVAGRFTMVLGR